jgi:uncharacterized Zn finger protein (UPF0148 family)
MRCKHPGYQVKDGQLVCSQCGEPSPNARLVGGQVTRIPRPVTAEAPIQDKAKRIPETKSK